MKEYKLIHFSNNLKIDLNRTYDLTKTRALKPNGLWVSNEDDYGWSQWVYDNEFDQGRMRMTYKHEIVLHKAHNIRIIDTPEDFLKFQTGFALIWPNMIDWQAVCQLYQGIIIPHYFSQFRLERGSEWYYP